MKILFDIDDTVCVTAPTWTQLTKEYMEFMGKEKTNDETYDLEKAYGLTEPESKVYMDYMNKNMPYESLPPIDGASEFINKLIRWGYSIGFITKRPYKSCEATVNWLKNTLKVPKFDIYWDENIDLKASNIKLLVDNNLGRYEWANKNGCFFIAFAGVALENSNLKINGVAPYRKSGGDIASNYNSVEHLFMAYNHMFSNIKKGTYVKLIKDKNYAEAKHYPTELYDKFLKVIDYYKDPETDILRRVSVVCDEIDNPKSNYNCFYFSGHQVTPEYDYVTYKNEKNPMEGCWYEVKEAYIIVDRRPIKEIKKVKVIGTKYKNWYTIDGIENNGRFFINKKDLFETSEEALEYLNLEM